MVAQDSKISTTQILVPMSLMAFTLALLFAFQLTQVVRDRDALHQTVGRMDAPLQESMKLNAQLGGLISGTQKLATEGNKNAKMIVDRLKQLGVLADPAKQQEASPAPVPAAKEKAPPGPVKP